MVRSIQMVQDRTGFRRKPGKGLQQVDTLHHSAVDSRRGGMTALHDTAIYITIPPSMLRFCNEHGQP